MTINATAALDVAVWVDDIVARRDVRLITALVSAMAATAGLLLALEPPYTKSAAVVSSAGGRATAIVAAVGDTRGPADLSQWRSATLLALPLTSRERRSAHFVIHRDGRVERTIAWAAQLPIDDAQADAPVIRIRLDADWHAEWPTPEQAASALALLRWIHYRAGQPEAFTVCTEHADHGFSFARSMQANLRLPTGM